MPRWYITRCPTSTVPTVINPSRALIASPIIPGSPGPNMVQPIAEVCVGLSSSYYEDIYDHLEKCLRVPLMSVALMVGDYVLLSNPKIAQELDSLPADDPFALGSWTQDELDMLQLMVHTLGRRYVDVVEGGDARWNKQC